MNKLVATFLFLGFFTTHIFSLNTTPIDDSKKMKIVSSHQVLEFYLNKGFLEAKLSVTKKFESLSKSIVNANCTVFFDKYSEVEKIRRDGRKLKPIIADYNSDGIFHSDIKVCYFDYPLRYEGDQVELSYIKKFTEVKFLDPLYFIDLHDVEKSQITIIKPDWVKLNLVQWNFEGYDIEIIEEREKKNKIFTFVQNNAEFAMNEKYTPSRSKIYPHIIPIPQEYTDDNDTYDLMHDVSDMYEWYASLVTEIGNDITELKALVLEITEGKVSDLEKASALFYWVQDNIRYVAFENGIMGFRPEACQYVLFDKFGDCKGMANLLKEMLILAGMDARLTWIGTSDLPYDYSIPSLIVDNHMICTLIHNGENIYLDPTEKHSDIYNYGRRIVGRPALIEDGESYKVVTVPTSKSQDFEKTTLNLSIVDNRFIGEGLLTFSGDDKTRILSYLSGVYKEDKVNFMQKYIGKADRNVQVSLPNGIEKETRDRELSIVYSVKIENQILDIGGELYINPEYHFPLKELELEAGRKISFEIPSNGITSNTSTISIPEGWKLNYVPARIDFRNEKYDIQMGYEVEGSNIKYQREIVINDRMILPEEFDSWNEMIKKVNEFYSDQLILIKK